MENFDVVIVGAGISGISAAVHLRRECPEKRICIVERRENLGGTWDLFQYPGIRSDSDMHTLGFRFKPWINEKAIADGPSIVAYLKETIEEFELGDLIRYQHRLTDAEWSSEHGQWTLSVEHGQASQTITANFVFMCAGYYSYDEAHSPAIPGRDQFAGAWVEPQFWPEHLDYRNKKVVVIGSGATAMTIVPSMAEGGAQVTMLQRSPTYVVARSAKDWLANALRRILPDSWAYWLTRQRNIVLQRRVYKQARAKPEAAKQYLLDLTRKMLPDGYDVDTHFTPRYNPWEQRLCLVPDADLFKAIKAGSAKVVTDKIEEVTAQGIRLQSGAQLDADIIVQATGLKMAMLGNVPFWVDGTAVDFSQTYTYKGMMYSGVPNLLSTFGYINASWTLRADLNSEYVCRLLRYMDGAGVDQVTPCLSGKDQDMEARPWVDDFPAGYMQRAMHLFPKQGQGPWSNSQDFAYDQKMLRNGPIDDGVLRFTCKAEHTDVREDLASMSPRHSAG